MTGLKSPHKTLDVSPGIKTWTLFQSTENEKVRFDWIAQGDGSLNSMTLLFKTNLYYINLMTTGFCIFEHLKPDYPKLFDQNWVNGPDVELQSKGLNITLLNGAEMSNLNLYKIKKGTISSRNVVFLLFNNQGTDTFDIQFYTTADQVPVRFKILKMEGQDVDVDVLGFDSYEKDPFTDAIFDVNVKDSCH